MEDLLISKDLILLNDGSQTRVNKGTGGESTLDSTFCGRAWNNKATWRVEDPIGSSDHTPILVEIHTNVNHVKTLPRATRWKSRDVDWESFKLAVEERMNQDDPSDLSITERIIRFNEILIETDKKKVGKT